MWGLRSLVLFRELSNSAVRSGKHREGAKIYKDIESLRKQKAEQKRVARERRWKNPIRDDLVLQVRGGGGAGQLSWRKNKLFSYGRKQRERERELEEETR